MFEDEEPKDWEVRDEEPPERLKERWAKEELLGQPPVVCPSCRQPVPAENLYCLFCGGRIFGKVSEDQGVLKRLTGWLGRFFSKKGGK